MQAYLLRRLLLFIPTLVAVSIVVFIILRGIPGDPAMLILSGGPEGSGQFTQEQLHELRVEMGLDKPLVVQYLDWAVAFVRGDWGTSIRYNTSVLSEVGRRLPMTLEVALGAMVIALALGIPIGVLCALRQDSPIDYIVRVFSIMGMAMPTFWVAATTILVLSVAFNWFPPLAYAHLWVDPVKNLKQVFLPMAVLGYYFAAYIARMARAQMLEVLRQDYIRTALAKGLTGRTMVSRHALKNAILPVATLSGVYLGHLMGGAVVVETVFGLPGLGRLLVDAVFVRDYAVVQVSVLLIAFTFSGMNLIVDLLYGWIDPRIRYT